MSDQIYAITDMDGYVTQMRITAAQAISDKAEEDSLDNYISLGQIRNLIKEYCLGVGEENRPMLNESTNEKIFGETAIWIHNVGLAKLAGNDDIECAWDNDANDMVFWSKESVKNEQPKRKRKRKNL